MWAMAGEDLTRVVPTCGGSQAEVGTKFADRRAGDGTKFTGCRSNVGRVVAGRYAEDTPKGRDRYAKRT